MTFKIGETILNEKSKVYIIAEACDNHLGKIDAALEMVTQAKLAGANAIKFQHHLPDEEMLKDIPMSDNFKEPLYDFLKKYALTLEQHADIMQFCNKIGIKYLCTPFSYKAALELNSIGLDTFKIGSGEMTDLPSLEKIGKIENPMLVSTGMCTLEEIKETHDFLVNKKINFALMNCVSEYPPIYEDMNLGNISIMKEMFPNIIIGHSDHTPDLYTSFAAVAMGAKIIEKHTIIDKRQPGPDQSVSIDFVDLHNLVDGIRKIEASMGYNKVVNEKEKKIREWAFRSIVSTRFIPKGTTIKEEMIWSKRPGTGIPSKFMHQFYGKQAKVDIPANMILKWEHFE